MPGTTWTAWLTAALGCAAFAAVVAVGRRRSVAAWRRLAAPAVAVVVGIVALYRTTDPPAPYLATPLIAAGLSVWIVLATTLADLVVGGEASRLDRWRPLLPPLAAVAALAPLLASPAITTEAFRSFASSERVSTQAMASINASLVPMCAGRTASVRVALDGAAWSAALGAGVALQRCGKSVQFTPDLRPLVGDRYTNGAKVPALTVLFGCVDAPMPANAQLLTTVKGISADEIADVSVVPSADVDADSLTVHACPS